MDTWNSNKIPISKELVSLVKKLDGFNANELEQLKAKIEVLGTIASGSTIQFNKEKFDPQIESFLQDTLKIHQVLGLLEADFSQAVDDKKAHLDSLLELLKNKNGLDYTPREQTPQGRVFDHANQSTVLLAHLKGTESVSEAVATSFKDLKPDFYILMTDSQEEAAEQEEDVLFTFQKNYLDLTLKANGKANLYFDAYFWTRYLETLAEAAGEEISTLSQKCGVAFDRMKKLSTKPKQVYDNIKRFPFSEDQYNHYVNQFGGKKVTKKVQMLEEIQRALFVAQISDNQESIRWIERLLIQLLGYYEINIRDQAIVLLNMLYDGVDWQITTAFRPMVRCVGQHFKVNVTVTLDVNPEDDPQIFLGLSAPSPIDQKNDILLTWHKIQPRNITRPSKGLLDIGINFGKFWKCGFFDWRLIQMQNDGKLSPLEIFGKPQPTFPKVIDSVYDYDDEEDLGNIAQGRFIVHPKGMRDHIFHEVQPDYQDANIDTQQNRFIRRGGFKQVEDNIDDYRRKGVSALHLMGVFERDNHPFTNNMTDETEFRKQDAAPLAVTSRNQCCTMLGGNKDFSSLMHKAQSSGMKVIVDCLARVSSSRHHRKFKSLLLEYLDNEGRRRICYGTDGQARQYEDSAMLNYRKLEAWDMLVDDSVEFAKRNGLDGIHLDNGQAWPQIMEIDREELMRIDVDGEPAYSAQDLMNGEVVIRNENYGYWNTNTMEQYPNPFFIKLCRKLWNEFPDFMIIGECWGGFQFQHRQIILSRSGIIPRLYKMPQVICSMLGKKLHRDGRMTEQKERGNVYEMKKWYEEAHKFLPEGSILLQSSTAHNWPYPAYMYGKGSWAAVDILHFMPDVPITFMGEVDGEVYRLEQTAVFQTEQKETKEESQGTIKRSNSAIRLALAGSGSIDEADKTIQPEKNAEGEHISIEAKDGAVRVRRGSNASALAMEQAEGSIAQKEKDFYSKIQTDLGADLRKISTHYEHRRRLRKERMVLRYGELIPLVARDKLPSPYENEWLSDVLAFARYSLMETCVIATNLSDQPKEMYVDMEKLYSIFKNQYNDSTVIMVTDLLDSEKAPEYVFLREFMSLQHWNRLGGFSSQVISIKVCQEDVNVFRKALFKSLTQTKEKLQKGQNVDSYQVSLMIKDLIELKSENNGHFANVIGSLQQNFLDKINMSLNDLFLHNNKIKNDINLTSNLMALCKSLLQGKEQKDSNPAYQAASVCFESNKLGPLIFCSPELGRWSTVGGLGVMVDELSIGLANLGQDVYVISPYYERNRKGVSGYLAKDPAGIKFVETLTIDLDQKYTVGVHEGLVSGVKVIFLHQAEIFPSPYPSVPPSSIIRSLAVFGKACLEFCCKRGILPSVCITNDWFTGLIPGYAKAGAFGKVFNGTTFMHIAHNLQENYEGRIFPEPKDGTMEQIHMLPADWLFDKSWGKVIINPSRCAIMMSDQWSTVSKSYREDLLSSSSLAPLLAQKPQPFAFPNGIPIEARIKKLNAASPDHMTAKKMLQQKYFNFQELDDSRPLFAFVGRITEQKGVHLICDIAERIIHKMNYKVNFIIGGPADMRDPYGANCAQKMWYLKDKYPACFWAAPDEFFMDGALVNRGTDFGLMPSLFEPGGIVQHEFFVGSTPVVAYKTGGLKDSVIEFQWDSETGCGYTFEAFTSEDFAFAVERAMGTFQNKSKYAKIRENAFKATMPGEIVSKAWLSEFCRLRGKIMTDWIKVQELNSKHQPWDVSLYKPINIVEEMFGQSKLKELKFDDFDLGAEEESASTLNSESIASSTVVSEFDLLARERSQHQFMFHNYGPRHNSVKLVGSFDNWEQRHNMSFDHITNQWFVNLFLPRGEYFFKFVINDNLWVVNDELVKRKDAAANLNNFIEIK